MPIAEGSACNASSTSGVSVPLIMPENCTVAWTDSERGAPVVFGETVNGTARLVPGGTLPIEMPGDAV